jgi:hypothetical protein
LDDITNLLDVGDEQHEVGSGGLATSHAQSNDHGADEETEALEKAANQQIVIIILFVNSKPTMMRFCTKLRRFKDAGMTLDAFLVKITHALTDDLVLERLILPDCICVTLALMLLAVEVLDGLIVEQAVGMNATSDLRSKRKISNNSNTE